MKGLIKGSFCLGVLVLLFSAATARADIFNPAYLELREQAPDQYQVLWKVPLNPQGQALLAHVVFPEGTLSLADPIVTYSQSARVEHRTVETDGRWIGKEIFINGVQGGLTDVVVRLERLDGSSQVEALSPERPSFEIRAPDSKGRIAWAYLLLGIEHILAGIDHLLFVLALLLIVRGGKAIITTITAFTIAHSITLVAATLGWVEVSGPPVEAIIALSIVFVASEVVHGLRGRPGLTARAPWVVAFSFGLLHGLGFAGALAEIGLPELALPLALLMFNVGVEVGQLIFVAGVLLVALLGKALIPVNPTRVMALTAYAVGSIAAFWTIERVVSFMP